MYHRLKDGVFFVAGALNGAILDTLTREVYSVNNHACSVLTYKNEDDPYWKTLVQMGLAEIGEPRCQAIPSLLKKDELRFVWFEIVILGNLLGWLKNLFNHREHRGHSVYFLKYYFVSAVV